MTSPSHRPSVSCSSSTRNTRGVPPAGLFYPAEEGPATGSSFRLPRSLMGGAGAGSSLRAPSAPDPEGPRCCQTAAQPRRRPRGGPERDVLRRQLRVVAVRVPPPPPIPHGGGCLGC